MTADYVRRIGKPGLLAQAARFGVVGAFGFVIDACILFLLVWDGTDAYLARAVSFPPAVTATWYLNRIWTFDDRSATRHRQYARYLAVQIAGAAANYAIYALLLWLGGTSPARALGALAIGAAAGLAVNFCGTRALVFTPGGDPRRAIGRRIE